MIAAPPAGWVCDVSWRTAGTAERWVWSDEAVVVTLVVRGGAVQQLGLRTHQGEHPHASLLAGAWAAVGEFLRALAKENESRERREQAAGVGS